MPARAPRRFASLVVLSVLAICLGLPGVQAARQAAAAITAISPSAARPGDVVTIRGRGFGARNVVVTVGGKAAEVLAADGNKISFRVPAGVPPGQVIVRATNPGGHTGSVGLLMIEGILLPGASSSPAIDAIVDMPPVGVDGTQIKDGLIMNRLELRFTPDATIGQLNDALIRVNGGIVSMSKGLPWVTIAIPQQDTLVALEDVVALLESLPGMALVKRAHAAQPLEMFREATPDNVAVIRHLLPSRFPAAWNAGINGLGDCSSRPVSLVIADYFSETSPASSYLPPMTGPRAPAAAFPPDQLEHGWDVALVAASNVVGANPFAQSGCTKLRLAQIGGLAPNQDIDSIVATMPASGKFIVNYSIGFVDDCRALECEPPRDVLRSARERADDTLYWKRKTRKRWDDFLVVVAAGNQRSATSGLIYKAMSDSRYNSAMAISQLSDTLFDFVGLDSLWTPPAFYSALGFESLKASPLVQSQLAQEVVDHGLIDALAENVIVVGSATSQTRDTLLTQHATGSDLTETFFSDRNPDVLAVGENVLDRTEGTSFSAPQVSGLAAYLWQLQPALLDEPISTTKRAIVDNARNKVIDAYASVLSLDAATQPSPPDAPVRLEILDLNGDGGFNELDVDTYLRKLFVVDGATITHQAQPGVLADFSRYDLNGDGFTTAGARRERFDLDRVGSVRFGRSQYSVVSQKIEGADIRFDETALTDAEILCYYAYSDLYQGNPDTRKDLLAGRCGLSIEPKTATLNPGATLQFTAHVPGDTAVSWTATCGTIDAHSGSYRAPATSGSCTVRATSVPDPSAFAEATVTVIQSSTNHIRMGRSCATSAFSFNPFVTPVEVKHCSESVVPYTAPSVDIGGPTGGVYSYSATYTEKLSAVEVETDAISSGTLTLHGHVDAAQAPVQPPFTGPIQVNAGSTTSLSFQALEGQYQVTVTGQLSITLPHIGRGFAVNLNVGTVPVPSTHCAIPLPLTSVDLSHCVLSMTEVDVLRTGGPTPGTSFVVPFTFSGIVAGIDPSTGQVFPNLFGISSSVTAIAAANTHEPSTGDVTLSLNFSFTRIQ